VLDTLERVGYVDDERFARTRAEALAARGFGDEAIRADLERHGVAVEARDEAIAALEPEAARARALVDRLGQTPKTAGRLARKGFSAEALEAALGELAAGDGP
jgi:SOS response regulatory protein OraA/RecX